METEQIKVRSEKCHRWLAHLDPGGPETSCFVHEGYAKRFVIRADRSAGSSKYARSRMTGSSRLGLLRVVRHPIGGTGKAERRRTHGAARR
jgi:hypothetical protein